MDFATLKQILVAAAETAGFVLLVFLLWRWTGKLQDWIEQRASEEPIDEEATRFSWVVYARTLVSRVVWLATWFVTGALVLTWVSLVLYEFSGTRELAERIAGVFTDALAQVGSSSMEALPGLVVVGVLLLVAQAAVEASNAVFRAISHRELKVAMIHPETASATRRLVALGIWALALVSVYPYLPGSNSEVFKGVSVLLGAMLTLGSSGVVTQLMSGLVLVYSRALRVGDYVIIGENEGVVQQVGTLATKLQTMRNEEITIPNAVLVANPIRNFSKLAGSQGTMASTQLSIGYDAPWRTVHQLLMSAAQHTEGIRIKPDPFVLQRALNDFYVVYELYFYMDRPMDRLPVLSRLHGHIQDAFNTAGIQIMSPHFMTQPDKPVLAEVGDPARAR